MFKEEQHNTIGVPTYRQPLLQAMKVFLLAPFFRRLQNGEKNAGHYPIPFYKPF